MQKGDFTHCHRHLPMHRFLSFHGPGRTFPRQSRGGAPVFLECFVSIAIADEETQQAAKLFGAAEALHDIAQSPITDQERVEYHQSVAQLSAMTMEQAIRLRSAKKDAVLE